MIKLIAFEMPGFIMGTDLFQCLGLNLANTLAGDPYLAHCREQGLPLHPARMPHDLAAFFIKFLTEARDVVLDPFAGSNTTGAAAEDLKRRWVAIEPNGDYLEGSRGRFSATLAG